MPKDEKHDFAVTFCGTLMVDQSDCSVVGKNFLVLGIFGMVCD
jgi:hypothetical protein